MADSDTTQQVTSKTPATKQKNPIRVAAGKAMRNKLKNDYIITKELSDLSDSLALICGRLRAVAITAKHVDFSGPLAGQDEVGNAKQFLN